MGAHSKPVDVSVDRARLEGAVAEILARHPEGRVTFQGETVAVVVIGRPVHHLLHLFATIVTGGLWLPAWIYLALTGGESTLTLSLDPAGSVQVLNPNRTVTTGTVRPTRVGSALLMLIGALFVLLGIGSTSFGFPALGLGVAAVVTGAWLLVADVRRHGTGRVVTVTGTLHQPLSRV